MDDYWFDAKGDAHWINPVNGKFEKIPDGARVSVDHILPQNYINNMNGFNKLPVSVQESLINDSSNLQPMVKSANCSKSCRVEFVDGGWKTWKGEPVSFEYKKYLTEVQKYMQSKINAELSKRGL